MRKLSSKKWFFYISNIVIICYFTFVLILFNSNQLPFLYSREACGIYYLFIYLLLSAVLYVIDTHTRKEPGFLTLFCLPLFTLFYLLGCMMCSGKSYPSFIVLFLSIVLVFIFGFFINKYWIEKILSIKNGYQNILFIYILIHLMVALYISFSVLGYM